MRRRSSKKIGIAYPVLLDEGGHVFDAYRVRGLPTALLIDGKGKLVRRWEGFNAGTAAEIEFAADAAAAER
jgi:hypothetical protein